MNHSSDHTSKHVAAALAGTGVHAGRPVHANLTAPALVAESLRRREGRLSIDGSLMVETGVHTGRSVRDKFVVDEPSVTRDIWWGTDQPTLRAREIRGTEGPRAGLFAGPGSVHPGPVCRRRPGSSRARPPCHHLAWASLFARNMFIRPPAHELDTFEPDYVILHAPLFQTDPAIDGTRSSTTIALSFEQKFIVIAGTRIRRRDQEIDLYRDELDFARQGHPADALQRQHRPRGRRRAVLRPVRHRQDHPVLRPAPPPDRR